MLILRTSLIASLCHRMIRLLNAFMLCLARRRRAKILRFVLSKVVKTLHSRSKSIHLSDITLFPKSFVTHFLLPLASRDTFLICECFGFMLCAPKVGENLTICFVESGRINTSPPLKRLLPWHCS